ncbi:MAG: HDOD domain-containing protein, partial [Glaciecola sp.]
SVTELVSLSNSPNFDVKEVTKVIERDVGLAYKLMRFVNNPLINKRQKIESLQHALNYMGHIEIKKFIALLALANLRGEKPGELLIQSLVRARFCSLMSVELELPENPPSSFILGLFSMLDALLDQPMESLVQKLPVGAELQDALCHKNKDSNMGLQLRACYAFEEANWDEIDYIAAEFELTGERLYTLYYEAMHWAQNMSTSLI